MSTREIRRASWKLADYGSASFLRWDPSSSAPAAAGVEDNAGARFSTIASKGSSSTGGLPWWHGVMGMFQKHEAAGAAAVGGLASSGSNSSSSDSNNSRGDGSISSNSSNGNAVRMAQGSGVEEGQGGNGIWSVRSNGEDPGVTQHWQVVRDPPYDTPSYSAPEVSMK